MLALAEHGLDPRDIDQFVIDGWDGEIESQFQVLSGAVPIALKGAPYVERHAEGLLDSVDGFGLILGGKVFPYKSYPHVTGHVASAYSTSPFFQRGKTRVLSGMGRLHLSTSLLCRTSGARLIASLFPMIGHAYAAAGLHFGPYRQPNCSSWDLGIAGKLMAYIALGSVDESIVAVFQELYEKRFAADTEQARRYRADINNAESSLQLCTTSSRQAHCA